ncbi:7356_t:CDS:2 [Entrophospora sp. SA101]|nr:7356_t:CDS:2 [Entrophospora sp. SA101]
MEVHQSGYAWRYIRASMSLSGFLPPICDNGNLLVDGGYMDNLPVGIMKSMGADTIIAVDVASHDDTSPVYYGDSLSGWWVLLNKFNPFSNQKIPSIADIQSRLAYVSSVKTLEEAKNTPGCLYMEMPVQQYGTLEFSKFDEIFEVGYKAGKELLIRWKAEGKIAGLIDKGCNGYLENAEGEDVTFYSWLGVKPTASEKEINKAYRKLSLTLHPDKNPDRDSKEKFSRLGLIGAILRNSESRERYNFFLKNGVPKWRGTGYYYNRHRPGLESREIAWGKRMKKQNTRKKIFVNEKNFIVDYDNVFLLTKDGKQFIMDENEIEKPRILNIFT